MSTKELDSEQKEKEKRHALYREDRKELIDASRESSRTFDQAMLAFGSAVFGFSIAFLKDIAPKPAPGTLMWLGIAWTLFAFGLLTILLSFLFSQRGCRFEIDCATLEFTKTNHKREKNRWNLVTDACNYICVGCFFLGLLFWSYFAIENLTHEVGASMDKNQKTDVQKRGYVPPPPPAKVPVQQPASPAPREAPKK